MSETASRSAITCKNLSYQIHDRCILDDLSFDIPTGQVTAILGRNGSGKSTLLRLLARVLSPLEGDLRYEDQQSKHLSSHVFARKVAYLPQTNQPSLGLRIEELVAMGRTPHRGIFSAWSDRDQNAVDAALTLTGLSQIKDQPVATLSGGQRQRAWVAMVLAQETPIILLDEPTSALDIAHQIELLALLRKLAQNGKTIVTVLHDLPQAVQFCDQLLFLKDAKLLARKNDGDLPDLDLMADIFGIAFDLFHNSDGKQFTFLPRSKAQETAGH